MLPNTCGDKGFVYIKTYAISLMQEKHMTPEIALSMARSAWAKRQLAEQKIDQLMSKEASDDHV
jgi:hypothetical protein